jgi:hypothetical protein
MLRKKLLVGVRVVCATSTLPLQILRELRYARTGFSRKLAVRMSLEKLPVARDAVRSLRGPPILLLAAASAEDRQRDNEILDPGAAAIL